MTIEEFEDAMDMLYDEMPDSEIIELHNRICREMGYSDIIYDMDDFDEVIGNEYSFTPSELVYTVVGTDFDVNDAYFVVTDTEDINTFSDLLSAKSPIDRDNMTSIIISYNNSYDNDDIQALLDQYEEEGEEE